MFVCNKVDPDTLFRAEQVLSQSVLLCILKKLGSKLEGETDLKFRYFPLKFTNLLCFNKHNKE